MFIPKEVQNILQTLENAGFEAYIVGGCVRDLLRGEKPKDWDVTTNAKPEEVQKLFPDSFYENEYGTVGVKTGSEDDSLAVMEVTTYRIEEKYTDKRHPDQVSFTDSLEKDLARRDFTVNAMAMGVKHEARSTKFETKSKPKIQNSKQVSDFVSNFEFRISNLKIIDPFGGQRDLENKIIRAVGDPEERFQEDALRMMRAVRFATVLRHTIEFTTFNSVTKNAKWINFVAKERIRDEFVTILMSQNAHQGIWMLQDSALLSEILPELAAGAGLSQNKHHKYTIFEHNVFSLQWGAEHNYPYVVKLAALLHDIGKVKAKRGEGPDATFYGHEVVGARQTVRALERLRFPKDIIEKVALLIRYHMFYYNVGEVTESSARRLLAKVGRENIDDLIKLRVCDRMGSGVPKPEPYRLRHFQYMLEKVQNDPVSPKMLKINGNDVMERLGVAQGPLVGQILNILLDEVLDDPQKNEREYLLDRMKEIKGLSEKERRNLMQEAIAKQKEFDKSVAEDIKEKYHV